MSLSKLSLSVAVCLVVLTLAPAGAAKLPETSALIPAETILVVNADNFAELHSRFEKTDTYRLYTDPSMARFVEDLKSKLEKSVSEDDTLRRFVAGDYPLPQGRTALAVVMRPAPADGKRGEPVTVVICQWGKELSKAKELIEKEVKDLEAKGGRCRKTEYRGIELVSVFGAPETSEKEAEQRPEPDYIYCFIDDCFIAADRLEDLQFVVAHATGGTGGTLGENADYQAALKRVGGGDIAFYLNVRLLVEAEMVEGADAERVIKALGIDKLAGVAVGVKIAPETGSSFVIKGYARTTGAKQGIFRILDMSAVPILVPGFAAGDACSFAMINLDPAAAYDEVFRMANAIDVRAAAAMNSPIVPPGADGRPGVELKKDVFAYLRPGLWSVDVLRKGTGEQPEIVSVVGLAISDKAKLEQSLSRIHEQILGKDEKLRREFLGYTIYSIGLPGQQGPESNGDDGVTASASAPAPPVFTVVDNYLLFGDVRVVEDAIHATKDKTASKLTSAKWYRKAASFLWPAAGSESMMDLSVYGQYLWKLYKGPGGAAPAAIAMQELKEYTSPALLPEFSEVKKYFGIVVSQFASVPEGFTFEYRWVSAAEE